MQPDDAYFQVEDNDFYASQKHKSNLHKSECTHQYYICRDTKTLKVLGSEKNFNPSLHKDYICECSLCNKVLGSEKTINI